jgi:NuA3 HAT complex component NTO1
MDRNELFLHPVNRIDVPDYYTVIKEPMWWLAIDDKIDKYQYTSVAEFKRDIHLVLDNAMFYNTSDSPFHRLAKRIKTGAAPLLAELDDLVVDSALVPPLTHTDGETESGEFDVEQQQGLVGDLEASLVHLHALIQPDSANADRDNLASLFAFELEPLKEPTPPPPSPKKRKYLTTAERKAQWEQREAAHRERAAAARATRGARAAGLAFEEEAGWSEGAGAGGVDGGGADGVAGPSRTRGARGSRAGLGRVVEEDNGTGTGTGTGTSLLSEESSAAQQRRMQRGVVRLEAIQKISDRERREQERALEIVTDSVDSQDQFKRFNVGWVLPEGSKRRRAEAVGGERESGARQGGAQGQGQVQGKGQPPGASNGTGE